MLIALSLAMYTLVPFLYVFNFTMYDALLSKQDCTAISGTPFAITWRTAGAARLDRLLQHGRVLAVARLVPQAFFLPNLTIVIVITFLTAMNKALKVMG